MFTSTWWAFATTMWRTMPVIWRQAFNRKRVRAFKATPSINKESAPFKTLAGVMCGLTLTSAQPDFCPLIERHEHTPHPRPIGD
jgi:hypothetical protein